MSPDEILGFARRNELTYDESELLFEFLEAANRDELLLFTAFLQGVELGDLLKRGHFKMGHLMLDGRVLLNLRREAARARENSKR